MTNSMFKKLILLISLLLFNCQEKNNLNLISDIKSEISFSKIQEIKIKNWYLKDIIHDSLPGISLDRAYNSILNAKKGSEVIVAVIDMPIDINHEDLKDNIWTNPKEVDNGIDDDSNEYIDDFHGWNFLGNKKGDTKRFVNYEYTRILRKFVDTSSLNSSGDSLKLLLYKKVKAKYDDRYKFAIRDTNFINKEESDKALVKKTLSKYFPNSDYTLKQLDSLREKKPNDSLLKLHIKWEKYFIKNRFTDEFIANYRYKAKERFKKLLNLNYNDRLITDDNPHDLNNITYGNNMINADAKFLDHGTKVAGLIGAVRNNNLGINGISNHIKIMPLSISAYGDEHDKDISLAIRYAVNNGAKVINMSFGKDFSLHKDWVFDAIKYAEKHDVLIITSAGNSRTNLNEYNDYYPNDNENNEAEIADNFLMIGATTNKADKNLYAKFSNYGNKDVDIFAPGYKMYSISSQDYKYDMIRGGTSASSAITSGVAALLFSYYPNLTAFQIKHIIMDSGVEYTFPVKVRIAGTKKDTLIPFSQLSKSGKIVNAYNALIMADSISKQ